MIHFQTISPISLPFNFLFIYPLFILTLGYPFRPHPDNISPLTISFRLYNQGVSSVDIQQIFKQASSKTTKPNPKVRNVAQVSHTKNSTHVKDPSCVNQSLFQNMVTSVSKLEKHIPDWDTNPYSHDAKAQRWKHITCIGKRSKFVTQGEIILLPKS